MKNLLITSLFILFHVAVFAQGRTIKGVIKDSKTNEPLPGVGIVVLGTSVAATTDVNGAYTIKVDGEGKKLVFSVLQGFLWVTIFGAKNDTRRFLQNNIGD